MKQLLFVSGLARSGTTALVNMLNTHPDFLIGMERFFFPIRKETLTPADFESGRFLSVEDSDTHIKKRPGWLTEAAYDRARFVGDKFPLLYQHFDYVLKTFPQARHLYIVRNPLSVAESYHARASNKSDAWKKSWQTGIAEWNESLSTVMSLPEEYRARFHFVIYEKVFASPDSMNALYAAFGAEPLPAGKLNAITAKFANLREQPMPRNDEIRLGVARTADWDSYRRLLDRIDAQG